MAFVAFGVSYLMRAGLTADASFLAFVMPLLVQGIALATFFLAMITILLDGVPPQRIPAGVGPVQFRPHHRGGFSASLVTTFWDRREALHQSRMADMTSRLCAGIQQCPVIAARSGPVGAGGQCAVTRSMIGQAYLLASVDMFTVSAWLCVFAIAIVWLCRRAEPHGPPPRSPTDWPMASEIARGDRLAIDLEVGAQHAIVHA